MGRPPMKPRMPDIVVELPQGSYHYRTGPEHATQVTREFPFEVMETEQVVVRRSRVPGILWAGVVFALLWVVGFIGFMVGERVARNECVERIRELDTRGAFR